MDVIYTYIGSNTQQCRGGTIYRLFDAAPQYQKYTTLSLGATDCYIVGYSADNQFVEMTRVSLTSRIHLASMQKSDFQVMPKPNNPQVLLNNAVATIPWPLGPSVKLEECICESSWVA
jgi:hypothetical protein